MYQAAIDMGITLMTITHRPTLWYDILLQISNHSRCTPLLLDLFCMMLKSGERVGKLNTLITILLQMLDLSCMILKSGERVGQLNTLIRNAINIFFFSHFYRKFHTHILQFDGTGFWEFSVLNASSRLSLKSEKEQLLKQPETAERNKRIYELNRLLAEDSK